METEQQRAIDVTGQDGKPVLVLCGTIDVTLAKELHQTACQLAERGQDTAVGCKSIEYIDLSALQILLALKEELKARGKTLTFQEVPEVGCGAVQAGRAQHYAAFRGESRVTDRRQPGHCRVPAGMQTGRPV